MAKYYSALVVLCVIAIYGLIFVACSGNACTQVMEEMKTEDAASIMQKYKDKLNNSPYAKMGLEEMAALVKPENKCELYKRTLDSLAIAYDVPMGERKIEAMLVYEAAGDKQCGTK